MALKLFVDNDVILKLAQYGILEHLTALFTGPVDLIALDSAKYKLLPKRNRLELCKTEVVASRVEAFLDAAIPASSEPVDVELLERLNGSPGIDTGEALLFAAAASADNARVLTGDKRALTGLVELLDTHCAQLLAGKIIMLEALLQGFTQIDPGHTQYVVRLNPTVDKALTNVFGVSAPASVDSVLAGLESYKGHVKKALGNLLNNGPPF
jgi:hypothetical protein